MRRFSLLALLLLVAPVASKAQSTATTPTPRARYQLEARVTRVADDVVEDVTYLRAQLVVTHVISKSGSTDAPTVGEGTTLAAIVRDPGQRSILRALSPTESVPLELGWYDQSVYEVLKVFSLTKTQTSAPAKAIGGLLNSTTAISITLILVVALLAALALVLLRHYD